MTTAGPTTSTAPDWSTQTEEIHCPLCEYNLRGLTEPRCPECGHQFEWAKLLDPAERVHPYLFEHHPKRNAWSYARTLLGGMLPGRFWRSLQPIQRIDRRRMVMYYGLSVLMLVVPFALFYVRASIPIAAFNQRTRPIARANWLRLNPQHAQRWLADGSLDRELEEYYPLPPSWGFFRQVLHQRPMQGLVALLLVIASWPWVAMAILMIFRASMRQARIHSLHVLRCTIYSADPGPVLAAVVVFAGISLFARVYPRVLPSLNDPWLWWLTLIVGWGLVTWRLMQAYRRYLRFPHAIGVVLSVQVIFFLLAAQVIVLMQGYGGIERIVSPWRW